MKPGAKARCACGIWIIGDRALWATPTCVGCLPPPKKLPIAQTGLVLLVFALLSGCAGTFGGPARGAEPQLRTSAATLAIGLLAVDAGQTRWAAEQVPVVMRCPCVPGQPHGYEYDEINPLLGPKPSRLTVGLYFSAWAASVVAARTWAPSWASWALSGAVALFEIKTISNNRTDGISLSW